MLLLVAALGLAGGCVAQGEYDRMQRQYRTAQEQIVDLQGQLEEKRSQIRALKRQKSQNPELEEQIAALEEDKQRLQQALSQAKSKIQQQQQGPGVLPDRVNEQLARLAENNPELTFNEDKGMVKFQTDFTFDLGSAEVSDEGKSTIQEVAQVLNSQAAEEFEIRIVGHTDAVPIEKPSTKANHPTNWHLSVHRAIAIKDVLEGANVTPQRMGVAGYGPYRPLVPHGEDGEAKQNRRVELYLVQRSRGAGAPSGGANVGGSGGGSTGGGQSSPRSKSGSGSSSDSGETENPARYK
jgi:chemotaxis protein MotB